MNLDKPKLTTIALILALTFSATILALPIASAHDPAWDVPVYTYCVVTPDPVGVGQDVLIVWWPNWYPPTAVGAYGDRYTHNVEITKPDGSQEILGPFTSDPLGGGWALYTPTEVGTYTVIAKMDELLVTGEPAPPGGARNTEYIGDTMLASSSEPVSFTVQQDSIEAYPETPVTDDYWERPITGLNREWYVLAGNWLGSNWQTCGPTTRYGYGQAPESAHVLWATPMWAGGIMDERFGSTTYETGHYEGIGFQPPIILNGKIYYNIRSIPREGYQVLDLYTGEELWFQNSTGPVSGVGGGFDATGYLPYGLLSFGQIYDYHSPNQHGGFPYLWSTSGPDGTWQMFDAETGNYICSIGNLPSIAGARGSISVYGKDGSLLYYALDTTNDLLQCWNTSQAIWYEETWNSNEYWMWRPTLNETFDGSNGYSLNVSIPDVQGSLLCVREGELAIGGGGGQNDDDAVIEGNLWALSLEPGKEGTLLWNITYIPPRASATAELSYRGSIPVSGPTVDPEDGVFFFEETVTLKRWGYDLKTGQQLWESEPETAMNYYGLYDSIYNGKLYSYGYGGELIAYDVKTGDVLWTYTAENVGFESPYGNYPIHITCIADGKIYLVSGEHSISQPMWRGPNLRCIDAETGEELWKISFMGAGDGGGHLTSTTVVVADGYIVGLNYYDNQIYCIGKGPSETTVIADPAVTNSGSSVLIKGTVTDQSPGAKGTPAIADEYQEDWMEYIYMQQPMPTDAQGVTVKLTAIDPNGNFQDIGTVAADTNGNFGKSWIPPVPGEYYVLAEFEGSKSYGSSSATTYFVVDKAPTISIPMLPELTTVESVETASETPLTTQALILATIAVASIIGIVAFLALRKRK